MAKANLEFKLPEEKNGFTFAVKGYDYFKKENHYF